MKVGIIGSSEVGQALAFGFISEGHSVMVGTRDKAKPEVVAWQKANPLGKVGSFEQTAQFGELLVLAVAGTAAEDAIRLAGIGNFSGKVLIDVTNPIKPEAPVNGILKFFTTLEDSLMEHLQRLLPEARLVKAFNTVGNTLMYKPQLAGGRPSMFICGNDLAAKQAVREILTAFDWETEDMGPVEAARAIEPLCLLWCIPGFQSNDWEHAFKILRK